MGELSEKQFEHSLIGRKVVQVRDMTQAELDNQGWVGDSNPQAIVFDDGSVIFASDHEGNDAGSLLGVDGEGRWIRV